MEHAAEKDGGTIRVLLAVYDEISTAEQKMPSFRDLKAAGRGP